MTHGPRAHNRHTYFLLIGLSYNVCTFYYVPSITERKKRFLIPQHHFKVFINVCVHHTQPITVIGCLLTAVSIVFNGFYWLFFLSAVSVIALTILHMLLLAHAALWSGPLVALLWQGQRSQPWSRRTFAAWCLRVFQATVIATTVLGLANH